MPARRRYSAANNASSFVEDDSSSHLSETYHDGTQTPHRFQHSDDTAKLRSALTPMTRHELAAYRVPRPIIPLPLHDLHQLIHDIFALERSSGMDAADLSLLQANAAVMLLATQPKVLKWHAEGSIASRDSEYFSRQLHHAAEAEQPIIYRLTLADEDGNAPNASDIEILIKDLEKYRGDKAEDVRAFVEGLRLNARPQLCTVGFTARPMDRQTEHLKCDNSNKLMAIVEDAFDRYTSTQGRYTRHYQVLFRIWDRCQAMVGEILFTRLAQCGVNMGGFTCHPPGRSVEGVQDISSETWRVWAEAAFEETDSVLKIRWAKYREEYDDLLHDAAVETLSDFSSTDTSMPERATMI